jgi:signal transduction histidine kinase
MRGPDAPPNGRRRASQTDMPVIRAGDQAGDRPDPARPDRAEPDRAGPDRARPDRPRRSSLSNWSVSTRLVALFVMASLLGLVFGGLRIADAVGTASDYSRTVQLAGVARQITALAQAMEDERDLTVGVQALTMLEGDAAADRAGQQVQAPLEKYLQQEQAELTSAESTTNTAARLTTALVAGIGAGFPASTQSKATTVLNQIRYLPSLRSAIFPQPAKGQTQLQADQNALASETPIEVIESYSGILSILFALDDDITIGSGDVQLGDNVRALSALSMAEDQASQQRAILYGAFLASALNDSVTNGTPVNSITGPVALNDFGGLDAFITAQDLQFADQQSFDAVATQAQTSTVTSAEASLDSQSAQLIETLVSAVGDPTIIFPLAGQKMVVGANDTASTPKGWFTDMSSTVDGMRTVNDQLATAIVQRSQALQHSAFESAVLTAVVTVAVVLLVLLATALVARSMVNPLRRLQTDALEIASVRLPARVAAAAGGTDLAEADPATFGYVEPIGVQGTDEIARVARAFDQVHAEAVRLAGTEAQLRNNLNTMFISLSRRSVPLIDRLSRMIDNLEQNEADSEQLSHLFSMDHLVTRMRRNSENLLVLAGEEPVRKWSEPVPLGDVARAASAEIEQYGRVSLTVQPGIMVSGQAAADIVHLLAELIENATLFSPRENQIQVSVGDSPGGGVLVEVRDEGVGVSAARLSEMNWRLDHPPGVDVSVSRHMGLFAVSRLAARHGIRVRLRAGNPQGLTALVWLPGTLTSREQPLAVGMHSRPRPEGSTFNEITSFGDHPTPALGAALQAAHGTSGLRQRTTGRPGGGRHRLSLLATSGDQPVVGGGGGAGPRSVWFAAKTPSGRAPAGSSSAPASASSASASSASAPSAGGGQWSTPGRGWGPAGVDWSASGSGSGSADAGMRSADPGGWPGGGAPAQPPVTRQTQAGLPQRVPRSNGGLDGPPSGYDAARPDEAPVLGAPPGAGNGSQGGWGAGAQRGGQGRGAGAPRPGTEPSQGQGTDQQTPRRRSPEAARNRLAGFQLGNRDATQAGNPPGWTPYAGEETSH